jgi:hypothetical protein
MTISATPEPGHIWRDNCYYLEPQTGACKPKYVLVLAVAADGDLVTAVLTSRPNGLTDTPACCLGPPRAGYYVGAPGGVLTRPTWTDFNSLQDVDKADFVRWCRQGRLSQIPRGLPASAFCGALRCLLGFDDLTKRQGRLLGSVIEGLGCP